MSTDFGWPDPEDLPATPDRVVWHWTAGSRQATVEELAHYHVLVEHHEGEPADPSDDRIVVRAGVPIARNMRNVGGFPAYHNDSDRGYAAHTRGLNSFSVGLALCGMHGAEDFRPEGAVSPGPVPITLEQVRAMLSLSLQARDRYGLPIDVDHFHTHYEAEAVHDVDQLPPGPRCWKWNVTWVPGLSLARDEAGPWLRAQLRRWAAGEEIDRRLYDPPAGDSPEDAVRGQEG